MMGTAGQTFRPIVGGGEGEAADAPRPRARRRRRLRPPPAAPTTAGAAGAAGGGRGGCGRRRRRRLRRDGAGLVDRQAAVRPDRRASISTRAIWCGRRRTATRRTPSAIIRRCAASTIPKTGQSGNVGVVVTKTLVIAGDPQRDDDAGASARRDAARVRQDRPARKSARCGCRRRRAARR